MRRYAISDRRQYRGSDEEQCAALLLAAEGWARAGVDWIQLREKDLETEALTTLAQRLVSVMREAGRSTRVVVNGLASVARSAYADGVHLPGRRRGASADGREQLRAGIRQVRDACGPDALVSVACHTPDEATAAREAGASVIVFAPVFAKPLWGEGLHAHPESVLAGAGLDALRAACAAAGDVPVFALGGVTAANAELCLAAGAAGVAGIRLFAGDAWLGLR